MKLRPNHIAQEPRMSYEKPGLANDSRYTLYQMTMTIMDYM